MAPNQKLCSITHAVESTKEHFKLDSEMGLPCYYLTPIYAEASYILSDAGLQVEEDATTVIGVAAVCIDPTDNTVDLVASEGPSSTLVAWHLFHPESSIVLIPPQLSCPTWTGMRRTTIQLQANLIVTFGGLDVTG